MFCLICKRDARLLGELTFMNARRQEFCYSCFQRVVEPVSIERMQCRIDIDRLDALRANRQHRELLAFRLAVRRKAREAKIFKDYGAYI